jgi:GTP-binding protein
MIPMFRSRNAAEIKESVCDHKDINEYLTKLAEDTMGTENESKEIALVGRSNVGKSSLLNTLISGKPKSHLKTASERLKQGNLALTSKTPGKTNKLHFFKLPNLPLTLVDCPGYGFARTSHVDKENWRKFMEAYLRKSMMLHRVILLIDIKVGIMDSDKMLLEMLNERQRPAMIVLTKADKVKDEEIKAEITKTAEYLKTAGLMVSPFVHAVSTHNGYGMYELMANMGYMLEMPILRKP